MENKIMVTLEDGTEVEMEILLTFTDRDTGLDYVLYFDPKDDEGLVYPFRYDNKGNLYALEKEEEWELAEDVFNTYMQEQEEKEEK